MKNFDIFNTFLRDIIDAYIVALIMKMIDRKNIDIFWSWIVYFN